MKRVILFNCLAAILIFSSCKKSQFADAYPDPSKVAETSIEKQFAGFISANRDYAMYKYWNYFVVLQNTILPWTQTAVTLNNAGKFIPGAAAISDRWSNYYAFVAQYKDFLKVYDALSATEKQYYRLYYLAATIYFYDQSQKVVDLHGDIPWSAAGLLSTNGGNYQAAAPKYDKAQDIYTTMLDSLKSFADELKVMTLPTALTTQMNTQDFINHGNVTLWKKYCNSLRLRMLMRVSGVASFQSRVNSEISTILGNSGSYPLALTNSDNIMIRVVTTSNNPGINNGTNSGDNSDFYQGLIGWGYADRAGKLMIDTMNNNFDPRLRAIFEPGDSAKKYLSGKYIGVSPLLTGSQQNDTLRSGFIARYNRSTLSQNIFLPGMLVNSAEVNFLLAEYYLNQSQDANAKSAYEAGITQSINYYYWVRSLSNNSVSGTLTPLGTTEINDYLASNIAWSKATTNAQKLNLIAIQKWINYNVLQPIECWSEWRRLKLPVLTFTSDGSSAAPPNRWVYPSSESTYNSANYSAVQANDNLTTKIFWDVK